MFISSYSSLKVKYLSSVIYFKSFEKSNQTSVSDAHLLNYLSAYLLIDSSAQRLNHSQCCSIRFLINNQISITIILLTHFCLLPTHFCLLPTHFYLLPTSSKQLICSTTHLLIRSSTPLLKGSTTHLLRSINPSISSSDFASRAACSNAFNALSKSSFTCSSLFIQNNSIRCYFILQLFVYFLKIYDI